MNKQALQEKQKKLGIDACRCRLRARTWICKILNWQLPGSLGNTRGVAWDQQNESPGLGMATLRISVGTGRNGFVTLVSDTMAGSPHQSRAQAQEREQSREGANGTSGKGAAGRGNRLCKAQR